MKKLFISQLEALATTLEETKAINFSMSYYYSTFLNKCGYTACVCGEQALSGRLEFFPIADSLKLKSPTMSFIIPNVAGYIDEDLRAACHTATGYSSLAKSVTMVGAETRKKKASEYLTDEQLQHPHLTTESSPEHAASYIRMLIRVLTV
jgi:hypothetical protein